LSNWRGKRVVESAIGRNGERNLYDGLKVRRIFDECRGIETVDEESGLGRGLRGGLARKKKEERGE